MLYDTLRLCYMLYFITKICNFFQWVLKIPSTSLSCRWTLSPKKQKQNNEENLELNIYFKVKTLRSKHSAAIKIFHLVPKVKTSIIADISHFHIQLPHTKSHSASFKINFYHWLQKPRSTLMWASQKKGTPLQIALEISVNEKENFLVWLSLDFTRNGSVTVMGSILSCLKMSWTRNKMKNFIYCI